MANIGDTINNHIDAMLVDWRAEMIRIGNSTWRETKGTLNRIPTDDRNHVVSGQETQEAMSKVSETMLAKLQSPSIRNALNRMKADLEPLRQEIEKQSKNKNPEIIRLSKGLTTSTANELETEIGTAGYQKDVINPTTTALNNHVINQSTKEAMMSDLEHRIKDRFDTFTHIKAQTILQQFGRRLNDLFNSGATRVKYVGPKDSKVRDFCRDKVGKVFTVEEVRQWPAEEAPWEGMIPNTDRGSIFVNAGGYNCRHNFEYLDEGE